MQKITQIMYPLPLLLAVLLLLAQPAFAEAPAGHPESIDRGLRHILVKRLNQEGYMGQSGNNMDLSRGIADYLRDNRQLLANLDFPRARQVDGVFRIHRIHHRDQRVVQPDHQSPLVGWLLFVTNVELIWLSLLASSRRHRKDRVAHEGKST